MPSMPMAAVSEGCVKQCLLFELESPLIVHVLTNFDLNNKLVKY
jgi:hypothetical protein